MAPISGSWFNDKAQASDEFCKKTFSGLVRYPVGELSCLKIINKSALINKSIIFSRISLAMPDFRLSSEIFGLNGTLSAIKARIFCMATMLE
jgi:hypothetical protein